jgi:hypothetical protein
MLKDATTQKTEAEKTTPPAPAQAEPAAQAPPAATQASTPPPAPAQAEPAAAKGPKEILVSDGGEIEADASDVLKLPKKAFDERLKGASKSTLNKLFEALGVKDRAELDALAKEARDSRTEKEAARQEKLTAEEKLREQMQTTVADRDAWKAKYEQSVSAREMSEQRSQITKIAAKYVDEDYIQDQLPLLAKFLTSKYEDNELKDLPDDVIDKWFQERVAARPKLAKDGPPPPAPEKAGVQTGSKTATAPSGTEAPKQEGFWLRRDATGKVIETEEERRAVRAKMRAAGFGI